MKYREIYDVLEMSRGSAFLITADGGPPGSLT